ncbi:hypothetical protein GCM10010297_52680 [Streptomyces malachitofuscus]|nr:hypothetical protein GCM10010297_52680 [Streptomyces malachitofuscus]
MSSSLPPSLFWPQAVRVRAREAAPAMAASAALRLRMIIILDVWAVSDRTSGALSGEGTRRPGTVVWDCARLCLLL